MAVKYEETIYVESNGPSGNAFSVLSSVKGIMKSNGASKEEIRAFMDEATIGNYDNLIEVSGRMVNIVIN